MWRIPTMLYVTAVMLACACTTYAEIYVSNSQPPIRSFDDMYSPSELRYLENTSQKPDNNNGCGTLIDPGVSRPSPLEPITDQPGSNHVISVNSPSSSGSSEESSNDNINTIPSFPGNNPDWSKYPLTPRPQYPKYPSLPNTPQYPNISPQYPVISPQYPVISHQYPNISPQYPVLSPQYPIISPQYPIISPQYPNMSPQNLQYPDILAIQNPDRPSQFYPKYPSLPYYSYNPNSLDTVDRLKNLSIRPPKYYESIKDFEQVYNEIRSSLGPSTSPLDAKGLYHIPNSPTNKNIDVSRYITVVSVIDGMIETMAHNLWQYYEHGYNARVPGFIKYAELAPSDVKSHMLCVLEEAYKSVHKFSNILIQNNWIKSICLTSPVTCDAVIHALVNAGNDEWATDATLLIALGKASRLYLDEYALTLNQQVSRLVQHPSNLMLFLLSSREYLKPLIRAGSEARRLIPSANRCYNRNLKTLRLTGPIEQ